MATVPGTDRARGRTPSGGGPRLTLILRNRTGSEVTPAVIRRLSLAFAGAPIAVVVADETIKMPSTELVVAARMESLSLTVVRARAALADVLAGVTTPYVAIADADDRHPAELLSELLFEIESSGADLVLAATRKHPPKVVRTACKDAVQGLADPLSTYFVCRSDVMRRLRPVEGATIMALDVLLTRRRLNVVEIPLRLPRSTTPSPRRRIAEALHVMRLTRSGARGRAHSARMKAHDAAWAVKKKASYPAVLPALGLLVVLAAVLRFWALPTLHWYGHDEGQASIAAYQMLVEHKPVLVGQPTSRGVYLGPGYYYLVAPFYALFGMSPFAGAFLAALAGVAAVFLTYRIGKSVFGDGAGLAAGAIMATAPIAVYFGRFGWNPNTLPFFSALFLLALIKAHRRKKWLAVAAFCAGLAPQLHASGLVLPLTLGIWLLTRRPRLRPWSWMRLGAAFALPLLPMIAGELRNGFTLTRSWIRLLTGRGAPSASTGGSLVGAFKDLFVETIGTSRFTVAATLVVIAIGGLIAWERKHWNDPKVAHAFQTLALFQMLGLAGALLWRGQMFAYWLLPWLPGAVVLFAGGLMTVARGLANTVARGTKAAFAVPVIAVGLIAGFNVAGVANPTKLADQFEGVSPAAFHNVAAASEWIAARAEGTFELQVWTPYAWDTAHNSTKAFDYLLLRKGLRGRPGGETVFVIAMEDVSRPHLRVVRGEVLRRYREAYKGRSPIDARDFGGLTVFQLSR